jgi:hypothetical protein
VLSSDLKKQRDAISCDDDRAAPSKNQFDKNQGFEGQMQRGIGAGTSATCWRFVRNHLSA